MRLHIMNNDITIVTVCKGRLDFLKQTLPTTLKIKGVKEIIIVDDSCPDGTAAWVKSLKEPRLRVIELNNSKFNVSRARNAGAKEIKTPWIFFRDADVHVKIIRFDQYQKEGTYSWLNYLEVQGVNPGTVGSLLVQKIDFDNVGGYCEDVVGWGYEDIHIIRCLGSTGLQSNTLDHRLFEHIEHPDALRTRFYDYKDRMRSHEININNLCKKPFNYKRWTEIREPCPSQPH